MRDPAEQSEFIAKAIKQAIEHHTQKVIEEEMKQTSQRVEKRVREESAGIAASVFSRFSFERMGADICIRVKFDGATGTVL